MLIDNNIHFILWDAIDYPQHTWPEHMFTTLTLPMSIVETASKSEKAISEFL